MMCERARAKFVTRDSMCLFAVSFVGGTQSLLSKENSFSLFSHFTSVLSSTLKLILKENLFSRRTQKRTCPKLHREITHGSEALQHHKSNFDHSNTQNKPFSLKIDQRMCWKSSARSDSQKLIISHTKWNFTNSKPKSENPLWSLSDF